jgi:hypothetical protein
MDHRPAQIELVQEPLLAAIDELGEAAQVEHGSAPLRGRVYQTRMVVEHPLGSAVRIGAMDPLPARSSVSLRSPPSNPQSPAGG